MSSASYFPHLALFPVPGVAAEARKYFTSLKQCGAALDSPDSLTLAQLVGQGLKKRADMELAKLGQ